MHARTPKPRYCFAEIGLEHTCYCGAQQEGCRGDWQLPTRSLPVYCGAVCPQSAAAAMHQAREIPFSSNYPASLMPSDAFPPVHRASQSAAASSLSEFDLAVYITPDPYTAFLAR